MTPHIPTSPKWPNEAIESAFRRDFERTGEVPRRADWKRATKDHPSASTVEIRYGSWSAAATAAGLPAPRRGPRGPRWTQERIFAAIRAWFEKYGEPPYHRDWVTTSEEHPSSATVINRCGSFPAAVRAAGYDPSGRRGYLRVALEAAS